MEYLGFVTVFYWVFIGKEWGEFNFMVKSWWERGNKSMAMFSIKVVYSFEFCLMMKAIQSSLKGKKCA